jgi:hypothetical protein
VFDVGQKRRAARQVFIQGESTLRTRPAAFRAAAQYFIKQQRIAPAMDGPVGWMRGCWCLNFEPVLRLSCWGLGVTLVGCVVSCFAA